MWLKQCHKPPIWEWFIPPIIMVMTGGLFIIVSTTLKAYTPYIFWKCLKTKLLGRKWKGHRCIQMWRFPFFMWQGTYLGNAGQSTIGYGALVSGVCDGLQSTYNLQCLEVYIYNYCIYIYAYIHTYIHIHIHL